LNQEDVIGSDGIPCYLLIYQCDFRNFDNTLKTEGGMHVLSIQLEWGLLVRVLLASKIHWMVSEPSVTQVAYMDCDTPASCTMSNQVCLSWMWRSAQWNKIHEYLNIHKLHFSKTVIRMIEWRRKLCLEIVDIVKEWMSNYQVKFPAGNHVKYSLRPIILTTLVLSIVWKWNNKNMFAFYTSTY
jgi:hypothetical protein